MSAPNLHKPCTFHKDPFPGKYNPRDFNSGRKEKKNPSSSHHQFVMKLAQKRHIQNKLYFIQQLERMSVCIIIATP